MYALLTVCFIGGAFFLKSETLKAACIIASGLYAIATTINDAWMRGIFDGSEREGKGTS